MDKRRFFLITSMILLAVVLPACAKSNTSTPAASTSSPTPLVENTATRPVIHIENTAVPTATPAPLASKGCTNGFYPVVKGESWSYSSTGGARGSYEYKRTVTDVSDTGFTTEDQFSTGGSTAIKWNCQNGNLSALDTGENSLILSSSKYTLVSKSVTADGYNIPANFESTGKWSEQVTLIGGVESGGKKVGDAQIVAQLNCKADGVETITLPIGKFDTEKAACIKVVSLSVTTEGTATPYGSNQENITYWYAKGVGFIQSVATGGINNETVVLTQYKVH